MRLKKSAWEAMKSTSRVTHERGVRDEWKFDERAINVDKDPPKAIQANVVNTLTGASFNLHNLLSVLRADAPGAATDDRFTQASNFVGMTYLAVHRLAEMGASSKFHARIKHPEEPLGYVDAPVGDDLRMLLDYINENDTPGEFLYQTVQQMALTGSAPQWNVPNRKGTVAEMYCLRTATMWPLPTSPMYPRGAFRIQTLYPYGPWASSYSPASAAGAVIPAEQITRIRNPHPLLYYDAYSPQTGTRLEADTINAINTGRKNSLINGVDQSTLAIEFDADVQNPNDDDLKRMRAQLEAVMAGPKAWGKVFFLQPGTHAKSLSNKPSEMAFSEGWQQVSSFLMAAYGVTKPVAGMIEETSYATLYAALKQFFLLTLQPLLNRIAGAMSKKLARLYSPMHYIHIEAPKLDDESLLENALNTDLQCGLRRINEIRIARGLPPVKEAWGNERAYAGWRPEEQAPEQIQGGEQGMEQGGEPTSSGQPPNIEAMRPKPAGSEGSQGARGGLPRLSGNHANGTQSVPALARRRTARLGSANLAALAAQFKAQRNGAA